LTEAIIFAILTVVGRGISFISVYSFMKKALLTRVGQLAIGSALLVASAGSGSPQIVVGDVQSYGQPGRLFYAFLSADVTIERYLLSKQRFTTEDGSGYQGDINVVYTYYGGAYEDRLISYVVHCISPNPSLIEAMTYQGDIANPINSRSATIQNANKRPNEAERDEYNLYWAVCNNVFNRFK
jgi:hypothetical protein